MFLINECLILVQPEETASPQQTSTDGNDPSTELLYKDKKEAIEAFKELLKDKVYNYNNIQDKQ
jgi:hypothetical protein